MDKFSSDTTLWQILRGFESGVAGGAATAGKNYNFTQRATPLMANGNSATGAGRLCYEMPTFNILGKQLDSLADLSKTLAQLGISGSAMLRLDFRNTQKPLEEAMAEITQHFQSIQEPMSASAAASSRQETPQSTPNPSEVASTDTTTKQGSELTASAVSDVQGVAMEAQTVAEPLPDDSRAEQGATSASDSKITVFTAPKTTQSAAASAAEFNPDDYVPTADHARSHQALLNRSSKNKKLLSEQEIAAERQAKADALSEVHHVTVRLRFPDQSLVQRECSRMDTAQTLYTVCRDVMDRENNESFELRTAHSGATSVTLQESPQTLIQDLGWTGRVLVTVVWGDGVTAAAKARPSLKQAYRQQAQQLQVEDIGSRPQPASEGSRLGDAGSSNSRDEAKAKKSTQDKESRMMNKLLGKLSKK